MAIPAAIGAFPRVELQDRYTWEAELIDGAIMTKGGSLVDAVRVSLIPAPSTGLPRHDLIGQDFVRRFLRQFKRSVVGGFDKQRYLREVEAQITDERKASRAVRDARRESGELPTPPPCSDSAPANPQKRDECLQVICCANYRLYVRHSDGTTLITPPDYELWL